MHCKQGSIPIWREENGFVELIAFLALVPTHCASRINHITSLVLKHVLSLPYTPPPTPPPPQRSPTTPTTAAPTSIASSPKSTTTNAISTHIDHHPCHVGHVRVAPYSPAIQRCLPPFLVRSAMLAFFAISQPTKLNLPSSSSRKPCLTRTMFWRLASHPLSSWRKSKRRNR